MDDMEMTCKTLLIAFDNLLPFDFFQPSNVSWNFLDVVQEGF